MKPVKSAVLRQFIGKGAVDFSLAKRDVEPFLKNSRQKDDLNLWSDAFFNDYLIQQIDVQKNH